MQKNAYSQPIGQPMPDWTTRPIPPRVVLQGQYCRLEPLSLKQHGADLHAAFRQALDGRDWTYMLVGPFTDKADFDAYLRHAQATEDPVHYAIIDAASSLALGLFSLMRMDADNGVIEVGHVAYSPALKKSIIATEAQFLLMQHVFDDLGYRRYEWKCDSLNQPSRTAALRLGFTFEGIFRNARVYKGRSRDTAWFSIIDTEWPTLSRAFKNWLNAENFDHNGEQRQTLSALIKQAQTR